MKGTDVDFAGCFTAIVVSHEIWMVVCPYSGEVRIAAKALHSTIEMVNARNTQSHASTPTAGQSSFSPNKFCEPSRSNRRDGVRRFGKLAGF
jgi:hypothetical protein